MIKVKDKQENILKEDGLGELTTTHENDILFNQDVQFPSGMFFLNESYFYEPKLHIYINALFNCGANIKWSINKKNLTYIFLVLKGYGIKNKSH